MKRMVFVLPAAVLALVGGVAMNTMLFAADGAGAPAPEGKKAGRKILVAYFSHTGNTREIAGQIHSLVGGDIFEIKPDTPYTYDYDTLVQQAQEEISSDYTPALTAKIENIGSYDVIFVGYPNWWATFPPPVRTFLTSYDFSGKTIVPFCTYGSTGAGHSVADINKLVPKSTVEKGFATGGRSAKTAGNKVAAWLKEIKLTK